MLPSNETFMFIHILHAEDVVVFCMKILVIGNEYQYISVSVYVSATSVSEVSVTSDSQ